MENSAKIRTTRLYLPVAFVIVATYVQTNGMKLSRLLHKWGIRWRKLNMWLLRLFLRIVPSEGHRVFAVALLAGGLCGLSAVSFHLGIIWAESKLIERAFAAPGRMWIWWPF
jgi:hypothetical protein